MEAVAAIPCPAVPRLAAVSHLVQARQAFQALEAWLMSEESRQLPLHDVEREQERRGRELPRLLLEAHVVQRGTGDVGPAVEVEAGEGSGDRTRHPYRWPRPSPPRVWCGAAKGRKRSRQRWRWWPPSRPNSHACGRRRRSSSASLSWRPLRPPRPRERPEYKRVWVRLVKKAGGMGEVVQELKRRDLARQQPWGVRTDGERALPQSVKRRLRGVPLVLDVQHVLAKLRSPVDAFHEEGSPKALAWVQERAWRLLHGEVS